jgi:Periplasmic binding protein
VTVDSTQQGTPGGNVGATRPWPRIGRVRRFGPVILIVVALVTAGIVSTIRTDAAGSGPRSGATGPQVASTSLPVTYAQAKSQGRTGQYDWGSQCDTTTGRLKIPVTAAQPCVPVDSATNPGATGNGVGGSTITVAFYLPPPGDLISLLPGATDTPAITLSMARGFVAMLNKMVPLYGRHVELVPYQGTGLSTDAVAGRADAINVAESLHAFASIGGPGQTAAYQDELAQKHLLCVGCGLSVPYSDYQQDAPYLWGVLPAPDTLLTEAFDLGAGQTAGKDAIYAGDPAMRKEKRRFGVVSYEQNPPVFGGLSKELTKEFAPYGLTSVDNESYLLDLAELPTEAATIVAHLKHSGVTTVSFAGDPVMPIYLTKAAAAINYYPEWVVTGTVLTDSTTLARYYDQREWSHAFGISSLPVPLPTQLNEARTLYRWYFGTEPPGKTANVALQPIELLFDGIELAGPDLTPANFQAGMFNYPPTGGGPTEPLIAYGNRGARPHPSYSSPADYTIIWYDATAKGPDEEGTEGTGHYRYVDGGRRYPSTTIPRGNIPLFDPAGTVTSYATPPAVDQTPSYPPWPGSPAATG